MASVKAAGSQDPKISTGSRKGAATTRESMRKAADRATKRRARPEWVNAAGRLALRLVPVAAVAGLFGTAWHYGFAERAWLGAVDGVVEATADAGLVLRNVRIDGGKQTERNAVLAALAMKPGHALLDFDPELARERVEQIPWVEHARVQRVYPDEIRVQIQERRPMALWQRDYRIALIDAEGVILSTSDLGRYAKLPLLVGLDAPKGAPALLEAFASRPDVASKITAAVRIGGRRWNIHLENGMDVRLPEHGLVSALDKVAKLLEDPRLAEKDLTAIDLRLPDRTVLQMSAAAASRRRDELKAAEDLKKKNAAQ